MLCSGLQKGQACFDFPGAIGTRRLSLLAERDIVVVVLVSLNACFPRGKKKGSLDDDALVRRER